MDHVVFLRAVNVGGRVVRPKALADELGWENLGAAGTFVARGARSARAHAQAIRAKLPFEAAVMVRPAAELLRLVAAEPFGSRAPAAGVKRYVSVLGASPRAPVRLPLVEPEARAWEVRVERLVGRYALSLWTKRGERRVLYPNEVVERTFGVPATTRGWETILAIGHLLAGA